MPLKELMDNPHSDRVKRICAIKRIKSHENLKFLVEGPQSVREAVRYASDFICDIYALDDAVYALESSDSLESPNNSAGCYVSNAANSNSSSTISSTDASTNISTNTSIVRESLEKQCYVHPVTSDVMKKISTDSQGIVAVLDAKSLEDSYESDVKNLEDCAKKSSKTLRIAACWQVRDPGNAGAIIRVADVAGCDAVVFVDDCVNLQNPKLVRSTAGSLFHLPVITMSESEWFDWASSAGVKIIAADIYGTKNRKPKDFPLVVKDSELMKSSLAVLFGNEARGLNEEILNKVDEISIIPIYGKAESMNLATSAAVMLMGLAMSSHERKM
ncbi:RNA methyltransferase, TrmH family [Gardnerella vaginalis]|uniref:RNA methyltransferase, TrmH family n=1 Tax=Gardnerella vaginalis TaxID=2702 RepID=A0A135Z885_GARVA|nr:RNA methyltransferase [Gardnerella vaginalis]KXI17871.1 RNA methyltransferase, TrmH family [Gardnerella vaginalis]